MVKARHWMAPAHHHHQRTHATTNNIVNNVWLMSACVDPYQHNHLRQQHTATHIPTLPVMVYCLPATYLPYGPCLCPACMWWLPDWRACTHQRCWLKP